jgi:hypothetical protein
MKLRWIIPPALVLLFLLVGILGAAFGGAMLPEAGAAGPCDPAPTDLTPHPDGKWSQTDIEHLWVALGGPADQRRIAGAVGMAESGGDPSIVNSIGAGGLMQIYPPEPDYLDPQTNMRIAVRKYRESLQARGNGWLPWETYTNGMYRKWLRPAAGPGDLPAPCAVDLGGNLIQVPWNGGDWPVPLPGFPGESCDPRIIPDVLALVHRFRLHVSDCYAAAGHEPNGEHPLGLAVDVGPAADGNWDLVDELARWAGWTRACGAVGVAPVCPLKPVFRFVGYDGYPNHGRGNHLHLSWAHGPGRPAQTVTIIDQNGQ